MKTVKKFISGKLKGYRITQTKDNRFHIYMGSVSQMQADFNRLEVAEKVLNENYKNLPNWRNTLTEF